MTQTERYIQTLSELKAGALGLLRIHAGQGIDETVNGFDLFAGIWWPLRERSPAAPRREVAWLIAKLYAFRPIPHSPGDSLARQLRICQPSKDPARGRFRRKLDRMLVLPLGRIEPALQWALDYVGSARHELDWVKLTDDLSIWQSESTRLRWAEQFIGNERGWPC